MENARRMNHDLDVAIPTNHLFLIVISLVRKAVRWAQKRPPEPIVLRPKSLKVAFYLRPPNAHGKT